MLTIPEGLTWKEVAMIEPLAISFHGIHQGNFKAGEYCTIIGAGPIGLVAGLIVQAYGG